jgi:hypothetical protein
VRRGGLRRAGAATESQRSSHILESGADVVYSGSIPAFLMMVLHLSDPELELAELGWRGDEGSVPVEL